MKKNNTRTLPLLILLCGAFLLTACSGTASAQENVVVSPSVDATEVIEQSEEYPSNTEDVVRQFLEIYPAQPQDAIQYLSPGFVQRLDENSAVNLLPQQDELNGYVINSGSSSAELEKGEVQMSLAYGEKVYTVTFFLIIDDGRWMIDEIHY